MSHVVQAAQLWVKLLADMLHLAEAAQRWVTLLAHTLHQEQAAHPWAMQMAHMSVQAQEALRSETQWGDTLPQSAEECSLVTQWAQQSLPVRAVHLLALMWLLPQSLCLLGTASERRLAGMWADMWLLGQAALPSVQLLAHMSHLVQEAQPTVLMLGCMWSQVQVV